MGKFALRFEEKDRSSRRGRSLAGSLVFIIFRVVTILTIGVMVSLGWMLATGDVAAVQRLFAL